MKRVAIIQARTGSTRLPRKVLTDLDGAPMLARVVQRVGRAKSIDEVVIATTELASDDEIVVVARQHGAGVFRGSENDVLSRYVGAAHQAGADMVVRITADCPLIDPAVIDKVVNTLCNDAATADYASNVIVRTYPRGLDVEALFVDVLKRIDRRARSQAAREHVTHYLLREEPSLFSICSIVDAQDNSDLRWTVDEPADFDAVLHIFRDLRLGARDLSYREILAWVRDHPELAARNAGVQQKDVLTRPIGPHH